MKVISWNVMQGGLGRFNEQIELLTSRNPDVIALQELTHKGVSLYKNAFNNHGYKFIIDSFTLSKEKDLLVGPRKYGQMIASKWPLTLLAPEHFDIPWKERVLSTNINTPYGVIEFHTTHIPPGSSNEWVKIETLEGIYKKLAVNTTACRILCGDFNTPKEEKLDGTVIVWGEYVNKQGIIKPTPGWGDRWSKGEKSVMVDLANFDLVDIFRYKNGYNKLGYSWCLKRKDVSALRRFDHIFASKSLNVINCEYLYWVRKDCLSDHSPIEAAFAPLT